ncbi:MAG: carotenoid biosynthesis protein [Rhodococcus sp. (in: high G+C Gram-positive bacteria)]
MNKLVIALAAGAIGAQIVYPLVSGSTRDMVTVAVVGFLAATAVTHAVLTRGPWWAAVMACGTAGLGLASEIIGTATGFPFGSYFYSTGRLGPEVFGIPAVIPFAWTAGFYPIWCTVTFLLQRRQRSPMNMSVRRIALTAVSMVGWDLYLDTQMVTDGHWTWTTPIPGLPGIPSIPMSNYLGWFLVSLLMASIIEAATRLLPRTTIESTATETAAHAGTGSDTVPIVLFMWTWLGSAFAHAVLLSGGEMHYSAIYGFVVMGVIGIPVLRSLIVDRRRAGSASV